MKRILIWIFGIRIKYENENLARVKLPKWLCREETIKKLQLKLLASGVMFKRVDKQNFVAEKIIY